ncbi:hotdog family protein [Virgibacillus senegalensis]|uniref:hypothetical protein n=1 Tax=Virgibacillus senegalensis TaxID=1499679 RepID=UPI00069E1525|nr:hypothetical protein [Virgibacillus senegalensis]
MQVDLIPQKPPFRFVDEVVEYKKNQSLTAAFDYANYLADFPFIDKLPPSFLIEGLAQSSVLFVERETSPLEEKEIPILGTIDFDFVKEPRGGEDKVYYFIEPMKVFSKHCLLKVSALENQEIIATGRISVAKVIQESG